jgi:hypothetical protein
VVFEINSYLASFGYTTLNSEEEKEKQLHETFQEQKKENELSLKAVDNESGIDGFL